MAMVGDRVLSGFERAVSIPDYGSAESIQRVFRVRILRRRYAAEYRINASSRSATILWLEEE